MIHGPKVTQSVSEACSELVDVPTADEEFLLCHAGPNTTTGIGEPIRTTPTRRASFGNSPRHAAFFRAYLPDEVQALFDWRTLRLVPESFLSDELQRDFADLRFTDPLRRGCRCTADHVAVRAQAIVRCTAPRGNCTATSAAKWKKRRKTSRCPAS